jgi:hypothetical protein
LNNRPNQRKLSDPWHDDAADVIFVVVNLDPHCSPWTQSLSAGLNAAHIRGYRGAASTHNGSMSLFDIKIGKASLCKKDSAVFY